MNEKEMTGFYVEIIVHGNTSTADTEKTHFYLDAYSEEDAMNRVESVIDLGMGMLGY